MKKLIWIFSILILFAQCEKSDPEFELSSCMEEQIEAFKTRNLPCPEGKSVYRYLFQDRIVFVFNKGNCGADTISEVYNEDCNWICGLGGRVGNTMCDGVDFWENARDETLIWNNLLNFSTAVSNILRNFHRFG